MTELFLSYCVHVLEIGESTGRLDTVLAALSDCCKRGHTSDETIQRVVTYPCVMTVLTILIFLVLLRRIFPVFSQVFSLFDSGISPAALFLLEQNPAGLAILTGTVVALPLVAVLALILFHNRQGLAAFSGGKSLAATGWTRFASAMSLAISGGLGVGKALEQTGEPLEETPLISMCVDCQKRVNDGAPFTETVTGSDIFSGMEAGMLTMEFHTGTMGNVMEELARRSQLDVDVRLDQSLNCPRYGLVILLCVTTGGTLLAVMLPLLQMLTSFEGRT